MKLFLKKILNIWIFRRKSLNVKKKVYLARKIKKKMIKFENKHNWGKHKLYRYTFLVCLSVYPFVSNKGQKSLPKVFDFCNCFVFVLFYTKRRSLQMESKLKVEREN